MGYTDIKVFRGGLPAWKKAKNVVFSSPKYLQSFTKTPQSVVVLDVRPPSEAQKGHIKGAYTLPMSELQSARKRLPRKRSAPIVLYGSSVGDAKRAFKTIRGWGYKNTSIMSGGLVAWQKLGNQLAQGALASKIAYVPKPVPGSIEVAEFKKIANDKPADTIILDVRTLTEVHSGMIAGALHIPTEEVIHSLDKLPQNKRIVVHCKTGIRAAMVYQTLKENGYKASFLNAKINIKPDGSYRIRM